MNGYWISNIPRAATALISIKYSLNVWLFYKKSIEINVIADPIRIITRPEKSYNIDRESLVSLAVDATTDPALSLQYRWRFRNANNQTTPISSTGGAYALSNGNRNLTINAQGLKKQEFFQLIGRYYVEIYHQYDAEFVHVDIVTDILSSKLRKAYQ